MAGWAGIFRGRPGRARLVVQSFVLGFVTLLAVGHQQSWSWSSNLHTVCPLGGVANLYTFFADGGYVAKLHQAVFVVLIALLAGLFLTGKAFCGWICPLGTVQEWLGALGRRLWPAAFDRVPRRIDRALGFGRYLLLVLILVQTARSAKLFFEPYDPYYNLFKIWTDEVALSGYLVVALTLGASLAIERPFCRYACPLGVVNGVFNRVSVLTLRRTASACSGCGVCDRACPVGLKVSQAGAVDGSECVRCLSCVEACPVNRREGAPALEIGARWKGLLRGRRVPAGAFYSVAVAAFVLPLGLTSLTGDFQTEKQHVYETVADIRGSSPLGDVTDNYSLTGRELYNGLGIPDTVDPSTKLKDLGAAMGLGEEAEAVSPEVVRALVELADEPLSVLDGLGQVSPDALREVLDRQGFSADATLREVLERGEAGSGAYLLTGVRLEPMAVAEAGGQGGFVSTEEAAFDEPPAVRGKTTLGDLRGDVEDFDAFLTAFGIPADEPEAATLRDLAAAYGFEIQEVRDYLAEH